MEAHKQGVTEDPFKKICRQLGLSENLETTLSGSEKIHPAAPKEVASTVTQRYAASMVTVGKLQEDRNGWRVFTHEETEKIRRYANNGTIN